MTKKINTLKCLSIYNFKCYILCVYICILLEKLIFLKAYIILYMSLVALNANYITML